jgi:hypothetical protein
MSVTSVTLVHSLYFLAVVEIATVAATSARRPDRDTPARWLTLVLAAQIEKLLLCWLSFVLAAQIEKLLLWWLSFVLAAQIEKLLLCWLSFVLAAQIETHSPFQLARMGCCVVSSVSLVQFMYDHLIGVQIDSDQ